MSGPLRRRDEEILSLALDGHAAEQIALRANARGDELGARRAMKCVSDKLAAICLLVEGETTKAA